MGCSLSIGNNATGNSFRCRAELWSNKAPLKILTGRAFSTRQIIVTLFGIVSRPILSSQVYHLKLSPVNAAVVLQLAMELKGNLTR